VRSGTTWLGHSGAAQGSELSTQQLLPVKHDGNQSHRLEILRIAQPGISEQVGHGRRYIGLRMEVHSLEIVENPIEHVQLPQKRRLSPHPFSLRRAGPNDGAVMSSFESRSVGSHP
jgi:hypothetical protein